MIILGIVAVSVAPAFIAAVKSAISSRKSGKTAQDLQEELEREEAARAKNGKHARVE